MRFTLLLLTALASHFAVSAPAERVISLAPHATELAFAAGLGDKLVAVSERSDYPEQAQKIEKSRELSRDQDRTYHRPTTGSHYRLAFW